LGAKVQHQDAFLTNIGQIKIMRGRRSTHRLPFRRACRRATSAPAQAGDSPAAVGHPVTYVKRKIPPD
jgi:hypothetical protein